MAKWSLAVVHVRLAILSAGIVGVVVLFRWRRNSRAQPLAPGHWILAADALALFLVYFMYMAKSALFMLLDLQDTGTGWLAVCGLSALVLLGRMIVYFSAAVTSKGKTGWRRVFGLLAIFSAIGAWSQLTLACAFAFPFMTKPRFLSYSLGQSADFITQVMQLFAVAGFAGYDAVRVRRDWLHGLGVGIVILHGLLWVGWRVLGTFE